MTLGAQWNEVIGRVRAAALKADRDPSAIRVVAVSKTFSKEKIVEAYQAGARIFGESYVQEALPKIESLKTRPGFREVEWHFIGALQSNKARQVVGPFNLIHSLDRWSLAKELEKIAQKSSQTIDALIEVNVAGEKTKSGLPPGELLDFARRISTETTIAIRGLMVFPPLSDDPESSRGYFRATRELSAQVRDLGLPRIAMVELSMGVTSDFDVAVEEGATLVRVGTAIFGARG